MTNACRIGADYAPIRTVRTLPLTSLNRGMSLDAIAALLGHKRLDQVLRYAKIANRTVADEYFAVTEKVESLYTAGQPLPATMIGPRMARLRRDQFRLLGNGYCTRPAELDCAFEAVCENCSFFAPGLEFVPILQRQHDDAAAKQQASRQQTFARLLAGLGRGAS